MKVAGLITEYNPFHNGHQYHIEETRRITGADYIVAVMSPDYVQRGVPAMFDKHTRTQMALAAGVDLVLELPLCYACSSAEYFALGAMTILNGLGVVDYCCFGSEEGATAPFLTAARILHEEPPAYQRLLKEQLKNGVSYPLARKEAFETYTGHSAEPFLSSPNNILGIEYCKALLTLNSSIEPVTIMRRDNNYHDTELSSHLSSATAIRKALQESSADLAWLKDYLPPAVLTILTANWHVSGPLTEDDFSLLLKYKLMGETRESLSAYLDVSQSLANRIINSLNQFQTFSQFAGLLKTKEITRTRINRALLHILLDIKAIAPIKQIRILGFRRSAQQLLTAAKTESGLPLITKLNDQVYDAFAANLYASVLRDRFNSRFIHEFSKPLILF